MIEIDGEFFEDPCELKRNEKYQAIVEVAIKTAVACVKAEENKTPYEVIQTIRGVGKVQIAMIQALPLWPSLFATGGIVQPGRMGGDIVCVNKSEFKRGKKCASPEHPDRMMMSFDFAAPGKDRTVLFNGEEI